jgi:rhodanese-related sulfurtransferase
VQQQMVERETVLNLNAQVIDFRTKAEVENDPIGSVVTNPDISFYTTKNMTAWLDELDPNAVYALVCDSPLSCYNSAIMTYRIKQKNIELMGTIFTNGTWGAWVNK